MLPDIGIVPNRPDSLRPLWRLISSVIVVMCLLVISSHSITASDTLSVYLNDSRLDTALAGFIQEWQRLHDPPSSLASSSSFSSSIPSSSSYSPSSVDEYLHLTKRSSSLPVSANCSQCMMNRDAKQRRIKSIKSQILSRLGLHKIPKISNVTYIPKDIHNIPPLQAILRHQSSTDLWPEEPGMLSDQSYPPSNDVQEDSSSDDLDYFATNPKVLAFAQKRKYRLP